VALLFERLAVGLGLRGGNIGELFLGRARPLAQALNLMAYASRVLLLGEIEHALIDNPPCLTSPDRCWQTEKAGSLQAAQDLWLNGLRKARLSDVESADEYSVDPILSHRVGCQYPLSTLTALGGRSTRALTDRGASAILSPTDVGGRAHLTNSKRGFRQGDIVGIGSLEARVLRALWKHDGWASTAAIRAKAREEAEISYNSVHTCLQRMARKGYLLQRQDRRGVWSFLPAVSQEQMVVSLVGDVWEFLVGRPPAIVCRFLTDALLGILTEEESRGFAEMLKKRYPNMADTSRAECIPATNADKGVRRARRERSRS
jgi:predicted transcriptional regulator